MNNKMVNVIRNSLFFDENFYVSNYPVPDDVNPAEHYLKKGWILGYDPSASFSSLGYAYMNKDILKMGINPLIHYELYGKNENRKFISSIKLLLLSKIFDPEFYIKTYFNNNQSVNEVDAASHYLSEGWKKSLSINKNDNLSKYVNDLPKSQKECIPALHYLIFCKEFDDVNDVNISMSHINIVRQSVYFNHEYYKTTYCLPDNIDAAKHYIEFGANKFFDPSPYFSTAGYLFKNKDVYKSNINPLIHYEIYGKKEKREIISTKQLIKQYSLFDYIFYCAKYLYDPLDENKYEQWAINDFITTGWQDNKLPYKEFVHSYLENIYTSFFEKIVINSSNNEYSTLSGVEQLEIIKNSKLFQADWYKKRYNMSEIVDPAMHYLENSAKLLCDPSPNFCTEFYLDMYGHEINDNMNPLVHYELIGRNNNYLVMDEIYSVLNNSELFNKEWYINNFLQNDIFKNPIIHYIKEGAINGYPPSPLFSSARYLINKRDVYDCDMNPLYHYIRHCIKKDINIILFKEDMTICFYDKAIQNCNIVNDYSQDEERIILFILPTQDFIGGGVLSINSIARVTEELTGQIDNLAGYKVILATMPSSYTFSKFTKFECQYNIYRFNMLRNYFSGIKSMIIHIPEFYAADFISQIDPEDIAWLHNIPDLKINILNQNNTMMPRPFITKFFKSITDNLTITCGHRRYCTPNMRSSYSMPVHLLSTSNLVDYKYKTYSEKENLLLFSPDKHPLQKDIINSIRKTFPELKIKRISNIEYNDYLELISRAKWMISFGEGLDGYAMESIRSGAISFTVFNHTFFNENFQGLPNIYNSYDEMLENITNDIKKYDNPKEFKKLNDILRQKDFEEKDEANYKTKIRNYYLENYTYPMDSIWEERKARLASKPLISIVMATYNGDKYISRQLESILGQTYDNYELIISDDGSTDDTLAIIESFSDKINFSLYHNHGAHGVSKNFENGLKHAKGEYVAFCDQDDIWLPDHLEKLLWQIDDFDIIHGRLTVIDADDNRHPSQVMHQHYGRSKAHLINFEDFIPSNKLLGCSSLIKTSFLNKCLPFPDQIAYHDWWAVINGIMNGAGLVYTDELVTKYRQHGENTAYVNFQSGKIIEKHLKMLEFIKKTFFNKLNRYQNDIIEKNENWCILYPFVKNLSKRHFELFFSDERASMSNAMIEKLIEAYLNK